LSPERKETAPDPGGLRWIARLQWVTAGGIAVFWVYFFTVENRRGGVDPIYLAFEQSFPVADLFWLVPLLILAGWFAHRGRAAAIPCTAAAGGAMVFLGLVDAGFNLRQGRYAIGLFDGLMNGFINLYCLVGGLVFIRSSWRHLAGRLGSDRKGGLRPPDLRQTHEFFARRDEKTAVADRSDTVPTRVLGTSPLLRGRSVKRLAGRHVLITGGSSGIGLATARGLAALGAHVVVVARDRARLDAAAAEIDAVKHPDALPCLVLACDVTDPAQVAEAFEMLRRADRQPDILINSAGIPEPGYFDRQGIEVFDRQMRVNYLGTVRMIQHALPAMIARGGGHIVNVSSAAGFLGVFGYSGYAASKFAVWGLSEVLRGELRRYGIGVSVVCPPDTDTPQWREENKIKPPETKAISGSVRPLTADAVADAIVRGIARRRFHILPGVETKCLRLMTCIARPVVWWVIDRKAARAVRTVHEHG